jgi:hypothetical protein
VEGSRRPRATNHTRATKRVQAHEQPQQSGGRTGQRLPEEDQSRSRPRLGTHEIGGPEAKAPMPNNCYAYLENESPNGPAAHNA